MEGAMCYDRDVHSLKATELTLGLPGNDERTTRGNKRTLDEDSRSENKSTEHEVELPEAKAQVVGWPPVRSYRKNSFQARKTEAEATGMFVKVSMDGAPYLRKIDLKVYKGYKELREALESMFKCFSLGKKDDSTLEIFKLDCEHNRMEIEGCNGSEYAVTYEDKDGDWMLVGDVPWGMFVSSCKRLRIMRGSEARGSKP